MAKFEAYVQTWKVGSECSAEFEIDDEELEGLSEDERDQLLDECANDAVNGLYEWGWREVGDGA